MLYSLFSIRQLITGSAGMGSLLIIGVPAVWAGCPNCQKQAAPQSPPMVHSAPHDVHTAPAMPHHHHSPAPPMSHSPPIATQAVLPPPGTLGQTYQRQSWPIPKDEHPRIAYIQVNAPGYTELDMEGLQDMEGFQREDGVWVFKTKKPLLPGVPHIYHVRAGYKDRKDDPKVVRTVRLIPGRVVTLDY